MLPYFAVMSLATIFVLLEDKLVSQRGPLHSIWIWALWLTLVTIFVGARFEVGGDWVAYDQRIDHLRGADAASILSWDPAYDFLNWLAANLLDANVVFVNLICAVILAAGLMAFCRNLPQPSLALQLALPYLVFVVGMGYTRQATAIGLIMLSLAVIPVNKGLKPLIFMATAALFHKAASILIPALLWAERGDGKLGRFAILIVSGSAIAVLLLPTVEYSVTRYLTEDWASAGASIRGLLNLAAAMIFLRFSSELPIVIEQKNVFQVFSMGICGLSILLLLNPASTLVDRMGLFFLPFQIAVFSCLPNLFEKSGINKSIVTTLLVIFAWCQLLIWLHFSPFASSWVPYKAVLWQ